jgi:peptidoglycan/LPS O-acetylase OafA/YrhL
MIAGIARLGESSKRFTDWMSKRSLALYGIHYLGISSMALIFAKSGLLPAPLCYIISLIAGFAFGYGLYEIISRIPFYRWAVLGIKKEKKHVQRQSDTSEKD